MRKKREYLWSHRRTVIMDLLVFVLFLRAAYIVIHAINSAMGVPLGSFDFQWDSAKLFADGINPYRATLDGGFHLYEKYYGVLEANQFPSLLMLLLPYTVFNAVGAKTVWLVSNLIFTLVIVIFLYKLFGKKQKREYLIGILLMICSVPWAVCVGNGQHTLLSFAFLLLSIYVSQNTNRKSGRFSWGWGTLLGGVLLGISYFKYSVIIPFLFYYIYKKWYKEIILSIGMHILLTVLSAVYLSISVAEAICYPIKISMRSLEQGFIDLGQLIQNKSVYFVMLIILFGILLSIALHLKNGEDEYLLSLCTIISLIYMYHRIYDFFILILPAMYLAWNRKALKVDGVFGKVFQNAALICFFISSYLIFFNDTIINKLGIKIDADSNYYKYICGMGIYVMMLYLFYLYKQKAQTNQ